MARAVVDNIAARLERTGFDVTRDQGGDRLLTARVASGAWRMVLRQAEAGTLVVSAAGEVGDADNFDEFEVVSLCG